MPKHKTEFLFCEYVPAPFPTGATALMSLGFVVLAIGIAASCMPPDKSAAHSGAGVHHSLRRGEINEEVARDFQADQLQYHLANEAMCPSPQATVFVRGPSFACYHWRKDCPLLHGLRKPIGPKDLSHMTRREAEAQSYLPCHYCCDLERRQRNGKL